MSTDTQWTPAVDDGSPRRGYSEDFGPQGSFDAVAGDVARDGMPASGNVGIGLYAAIVFSQDDCD